MAESLPDFQRTQYAFAAYIRDPQKRPAPPDVKPERMAMYRELFYNNVESFIAGGFPVLRSLLDETEWAALVGDFFARHRCSTPYFLGIPEEFLAYLRDERPAQAGDPPFLLELAHYEWVELALSVAEEDAPPEMATGTDLLRSPLTLSEVAWPLAYRFPVHRIGPAFQPEEAPPQPTFLAAYRDRSDSVHFMELNAATYRLLELIGERPGSSGIELLTLLARESPGMNEDAVVGFGRDVLAELAQRGIVGGR
jgi:uncharacterized protein